MSQPRRTLARGYVALILLIFAATLAVVVVAMVLLQDPSGGAEVLFLDVYESTGSRLTGIISAIGVACLAVTAGICVFAGRVTRTLSEATPASRWLYGAGILTAVLAIDDYLSVHELADDVLAAVSGLEADRALKNVLEAAVLGVYGLLFTVLMWRLRSAVMAPGWILLAIAVSLLLISVALDLAPHSWLAATFGISLPTQALVEDTLKLMGIAFYSAYFIRASAAAVRSASPWQGRSGQAPTL